jgi:hypothetical protein
VGENLSFALLRERESERERERQERFLVFWFVKQGREWRDVFKGQENNYII